MTTPAPWFQPLLAAHPDGLVPTPELFAKLLAPRPEPWRLTGISESGDPFLIALGSQDKGEPFAAVELDGATLVALEAAGDNGASECETWLVLEGNHLQTRLPHIPVLIEVNTASAEWDDPSKNPVDAPVLLAVVSQHTDQRLVGMGTVFQDAYYPLVEFDRDVVAIDEAARLALENRLEDVLPGGVGGKARVRL